MLAIARYALKGPMHAATVAGILAVLSLFIQPLTILSGAIVSLIILTQGLVSGTRVILVSIVGIAAVSYLLTQSLIMGVSIGLTIGLVQWLPLVILAETLRRTRSISVTLVVGMGLALLAVILQFLLWPDAESSLMATLKESEASMDTLNKMFQSIYREPDVDVNQFDLWLQYLVKLMTNMFIAVTYFMCAVNLLLGRWFQVRLAASGGFREEFYVIRFGKVTAAMAAILMVTSLLLPQDWLIALLMVMLAAFVYQGLAIAHSWSRHYSKSSMLVLLYVLMMFPHVVGIIALLGVVDNWIDFRAKLKSVPVNTDD